MSLPPLWKIRGPSDHCHLTGRLFAEGEVFYSCLTESSEADVFQRDDYCKAAWEEARCRQKPFSFWRSVYESKSESSPSRQDPLNPGDTETRLRQMMEQNDPATEKARYILALKLERKKLLQQVGRERRNGRWLLVYEHRATGEVFLITDPEISLDQVAELEQEVRHWLEPSETESGMGKTES